MKKLCKVLTAVFTILGLIVFIPSCILAILIVCAGFLFMLPGFGFFLLLEKKKPDKKTKITLDLLNEFPWWGLEDKDE